ncbi:hypothetical protein ACROYT_G022210, partial [Oculina patagonica]
FRAFKVVLVAIKIARSKSSFRTTSSKQTTTTIAMSWFKFFVVCVLLVCLMEPCFVVAQRRRVGGKRLRGGERFKREVGKEAADKLNTRDKRSLLMLEKRRAHKGLNANIGQN